MIEKFSNSIKRIFRSVEAGNREESNQQWELKLRDEKSMFTLFPKCCLMMLRSCKRFLGEILGWNEKIQIVWLIPNTEKSLPLVIQIEPAKVGFCQKKIEAP